MAEGYFSKPRIENIVTRRFAQIPDSLQKYLPQIIFQRGSTFFALKTNEYFMLTFVDSKEKQRIRDLQSRGLNPFPGLIKPDDVSAPCAYELHSAKNVYIEKNGVKNAYALSLGRDSSVVLRDFKQQMRIKLGYHNYTINLAYIVSFGDEINSENFYDFIDDLITSSFSFWYEVRGNYG